MKQNYMMSLLVAVGSLTGMGQTAQQMKSPTPVPYAGFGTSIVNKNNYTLVGAPEEGQGAAYLFKDGNYVAKYTFDKDGNYNAALGTSVVLNNDWYGVGIPYRNFVESQGVTGFAILGRRSQNAGLNYYLFPSDLHAGDGYGTSMAMSENWLAVGAPGQNEGKGAVYLWKQWRNNGNSGWDQMAKLTIPTSSPAAAFGYAVSIFEQNSSSDRIIVGAPYQNGSQGKIYVFKRSGDSWNLELEYAPANIPQLFTFGYSVDITQNNLIVGAPSSGSNGLAVIMKYENNAWTQKHKFDGYAVGSRFGKSVAIHNNRAAVGAPGQGTTGELHTYNDNGGYQYVGTYYNGQTHAEKLGSSVDIEADWVVTGAVAGKVNNIEAGTAYRMQFHHIFTSKAWRYAAASSAEDLSTLTSALLYPNPATQGKVNHNIKGVLKVKAFNTLGAGTELSFDENNIYMDVLSAGVYTLQITTEEGIQIQKLAVE